MDAATRVFDLGCGSGIGAILSARRGARVVAVDVNPHAVEAAINNAARNGVSNRVDVRQGDLFDPDYNILIGTTYLRTLWDRFDRRPRIVLAAYHMGPSRVARILHRHPNLTGRQLLKEHANPTTRQYVQKVLAHREETR